MLQLFHEGVTSPVTINCHVWKRGAGVLRSLRDVALNVEQGEENWLGREIPPEERTRIGRGGPYRPETTYHGAEGRDQSYLFHDLSWGQVSSPFT